MFRLYFLWGSLFCGFISRMVGFFLFFLGILLFAFHHLCSREFRNVSLFCIFRAILFLRILRCLFILLPWGWPITRLSSICLLGFCSSSIFSSICFFLISLFICGCLILFLFCSSPNRCCGFRLWLFVSSCWFFIISFSWLIFTSRRSFLPCRLLFLFLYILFIHSSRLSCFWLNLTSTCSSTSPNSQLLSISSTYLGGDSTCFLP